jgi:hypothetical protein
MAIAHMALSVYVCVSADSMNLICNSSSRYVGTCLAVFLAQAVVLDGTCIYSEKLELQVPKEII